MLGRAMPSKSLKKKDSRDPAWSRARRPEQKLERREAILAAATGLIDAGGIDGTSLTGIASAAGLSKANLYRYFESREAILLDVALAEAEGWVLDLETRLRETSGAEAAAEVFADSIVAAPRLCMLAASLTSVLERNVGEEVVAAFKTGFHRLMDRAATALAATAESLDPETGRAFVAFSLMYVAGAWPAAHPAPAVANVLAREDFAHMAVDFEEALRAHTAVVMRGLVAPASP